MAAGERERRELQEALVGTIGPDPTDTLLGYLPPVGWADVATKRDLDALERRIDGKIDRLAGRIDGLVGRIDGRIDGLEGRIDGLVGRIDGLEGRIDGLAGTLEAKMRHGSMVLLFWMVTLQFATLGVLLGVLSLWRP